MRCHGRFVFLAVLTVLCACGGGGSTTSTTTIPQANSTVNAPSGTARSVQLGLQQISATLPVVSQITGTLLFPAVGTPTTISLGCSATAPAGVALESMRRAQSGTLTVYEYCTIVSPITTSLPSLPAMTLHFPASTPLYGKSVYYGISDLNAQGGLVSFNTHGPGTIAGQTVSFAPVPTAISYEAAHKYTFVVYATGTAPIKVGATKIYVLNTSSYPYFTPSVTTYNADGAQTTPTITAGLSNPSGIAVDAAGKIYVTNSNNDSPYISTVTTYNPDGTQTAPTFTGAFFFGGIAVDAAGKIYVLGNDILKTYKADGTPTTPTITTGQGNADAVAVDAAGKIYVLNASGGPNNRGTVMTYKADGTQTTPTIATGLNDPGEMVDVTGQIYVLSSYGNTVMTYKGDGTPTKPTIYFGLNDPSGVAVDAAGKIYVANSGNSTVTTFNPDGTPTTPTITLVPGLGTWFRIAVH